MSETHRNRGEGTRFHFEGTVRVEQQHGGHRQRSCHVGAVEGYDAELDARADELEALRCLAYLLRTDRSEHVKEYLDQMDSVLDRMVDELKKSA